VAPEAVNLRANQVQWLRRDLYTLLLGNGNNRWSNVHLAEAMARLMVGGPVHARLVERVAVPGAQEEEILFDLETELAGRGREEWSLPEVLRRRILDGMGRVVTANNGTAHRLLDPVIDEINAAAPPGVTYSAFGKTGTPTLTPESIARSPTRRGPGALRRYGRHEQVQSAALVLGIERRQGAEVEGLAVSIYIEAQGGSEQAVALAAQVLRPLVESRWPEDWLRGGRK
jgi:cell division protein FtsI/penicillin-binding protein 2